MGADGTGQTRITSDPAPRTTRQDWSPDGTRIAFTSDRARLGWTDIFTHGSRRRSRTPGAASDQPRASAGAAARTTSTPNGRRPARELVLATFGHEECIAEEQVGRIETTWPDGTGRNLPDRRHLLGARARVVTRTVRRVAYVYPDFGQIRTIDSTKRWQPSNRHDRRQSRLATAARGTRRDAVRAAEGRHAVPCSVGTRGGTLHQPQPSAWPTARLPGHAARSSRGSPNLSPSQRRQRPAAVDRFCALRCFQVPPFRGLPRTPTCTIRLQSHERDDSGLTPPTTRGSCGPTVVSAAPRTVKSSLTATE